MKLLYTTILVLLFSFGADAQLKKELKVNEESTSNHQIITPKGKKTQNAFRSNPTFSPSSLSYVDNNENGLSVTSRDRKSLLPIAIKGSPSQELKNTATLKGRTFNFLENAKSLMHIEAPSEEFEVVSSITDDLGMKHVRLQQKYNGISIYGSEVIYHELHDNMLLNGRYQATPEIDNVTPTINRETAEAVTLADIGGITKVENDKFGLFDFEQFTSEVVIYPTKEEMHLAYHHTVFKNIADKWEYFVDAHTGEILNSYTNMCKFHNHDSSAHSAKCSHNHDDDVNVSTLPPPDGPIVTNAQDLFGQNISINAYESGNQFYLIDAARTMYDNLSAMPDDPIGTIWTIDAFNTSPENSNFNYDHVISNNSNFSGKQTGVSAQYNGGKAYEYFKNVHNRESINGEGGNVIALINISDQDGASMGNAFWNGIAMFYGNGDSAFNPLARGLDVAGHEMSHGVVQSTANLEYQGESGALNESFADIFGAMIDRDDWLIGEDVVKTSAFPSGALRSIQDPHNGASTGDFNSGWQPRTYSERFTGSQDNGGVHFNSGIPNWAFFKFANTTGVGKERAEKVYYRALSSYLTKSSQFIDARLAVVQASEDLYGADVANAAKAAFDDVEIFNGNGTTTQTDVDVNPGSDLVIFTTEDQNNLYISDQEGSLIFNPLTEVDPMSVPSVTDDGSEILFVNTDGDLYYIRIDWGTNSVVEEGVLNASGKYRNAAFSKDGLRMAALTDEVNNEVFVYDFEFSAGNTYELSNPTTSQGGETTGDVLYADALEFDFTGEYLMYDAFNRLTSTFGNDIEYWDIGFIKVYDKANSTFTLGTDIQKLFSQLPEGVSIGNPTFSKNSDYIIAFDFVENGEFEIKGANIETGNVEDIYVGNDRPGYPNYSLDDDKLIFDAANNSNTAVVASTQLQTNKIEAIPNTAVVQIGFDDVGVKWGVWFGNGDRVLADEEVVLADAAVVLSPNPVSGIMTIHHTLENSKNATVNVIDMMGKVIATTKYDSLQDGTTLDVSTFSSGMYILHILTEEGNTSKTFIKQ